MTQADWYDKQPILVVEDDVHLQAALSQTLGGHGYAVSVVNDSREGLEWLQRNGASLILADVNLPGKSGIELLRDIRMSGNQVPVVMMSAFGSVETAVEALKLGATEFLQKPFRAEKLEEVVSKIKGDEQDATPGNTVIKHHDAASVGFLTRNDRVLQTLQTLETVAASQATILIQGESGTGKEVLARYVHRNSPRANQPFVAVNCAALPEGLLESELFGYEKGAFTGALARRCGKFELAHQGTLLLDEIGEMTLGLQAKLLRVLQEREVDRLGSRNPISVDVRVIATTNRNLLQEVQAGRFREDVYYRLSVMPVTIPSLRERPEDIDVLVEHFAQQSCQRNGRPSAGITEEAMSYLKTRRWRGNVRELENVIERAVLLSGSGPLRMEHVTCEEPTLNVPTPSVQPTGSIWEMERDLIFRVLDQHGGNRTHAARTLGISIRTLRNKLREYRHLQGGEHRDA
ncbi:MAG: sigma-54-dependent Fis family transcriptional regulator [Nitrospirales bacterium]|nr:MAG: sigma-54-dependent Fis family transcriptional regulator [Nitrospirales bacterium]